MDSILAAFLGKKIREEDIFLFGLNIVAMKIPAWVVSEF